MRIYLDSNVFISLIGEEIDRQCRALFKEAEAFFQTAVEQGFIIVISELFLYEVEKRLGMNGENVIDKICKLGVKKELLITDSKEISKGKIKGMHYPDDIHALLAIKAKCDCIVTFNTKDFEPVLGKIHVFEPLDLA